MRIIFRLARRALLLAGRLPWLAFLITRCGLAILVHSKKVLGRNSVILTYQSPSGEGRQAVTASAAVPSPRYVGMSEKPSRSAKSPADNEDTGAYVG